MTNPSVVKREHGEGAVEELNPLEDPWHEADCIEDKFHWPLPVALTLSSYANAGELSFRNSKAVGPNRKDLQRTTLKHEAEAAEIFQRMRHLETPVLRN